MSQTVKLRVNGREHALEVAPRALLADVLRQRLGLTGTHLACEQGACGTCTVLLDGDAVLSCLMFAIQAEGSEITTIEGLAGEGELHPLQSAFAEHHGLQCGFCTPGMVLAAVDLLSHYYAPGREAIEHGLSGNLCRCTGYTGIVDAVVAVGEQMAARFSGQARAVAEVTTA